MAFVASPVPSFRECSKRARCAKSLRTFAHVPHSRTRPLHSACAAPPEGEQASFPSDNSSKSNGAPVRTKAEEITAMLGRDVDEERKKGQAVIAEGEQDSRRKYLLAALSTAVAVAIFTEEKLNPVNPMALLRLLEERNPPISAIGDGRPSVLDFYASWCDNCRAMAKDVFELEGRYAGAVHFVTVDSDKAENEYLLDRFDVQGVPQITFVDGKGKVVSNLIGKIPRVALELDIDALLSGKQLPYTPDNETEQQVALFPEGAEGVAARGGRGL